MAWTTPTDRATNDVITAAIWNQSMGAAGNSQFLYENSFIPVAVSTAAQTTTATSAVDLLTLTPTNAIGVNDWALVQFECRKTATNAAAVGFGLKVNATIVIDPAITGAPNQAQSSATNRAEAGFVRYLIPPRSTANYGFGIGVEYYIWTTAGAIAHAHLTGIIGGVNYGAQAAAVPNAAITSVTIRAINGTTNNNAEIKNAALYMLRSQ